MHIQCLMDLILVNLGIENEPQIYKKKNNNKKHILLGA